jgi:drug/metabolite transporter (DMT)-like permease
MPKLKPWFKSCLLGLAFLAAGLVLWFLESDGEPTISIAILCVSLVLFGVLISRGFKLGFIEKE